MQVNSIEMRKSNLLPRRALKEWPELIANHAVEIKCGAGFRVLPEQQLPAPVAVSINCVNEIVAWQNIEMLRIGNARKRFVHIAIDILMRNQRHEVLQTGRKRLVIAGPRGDLRCCCEHQDRLVAERQIENVKLNIAEGRLDLRRRLCGSFRPRRMGAARCRV